MARSNVLSWSALWGALVGGVLVVAAAACMGCSKDTTTRTGGPVRSTTSHRVTDSCSVITRSEAGRALGQSVKSPVRGRASVEGGEVCVFYGSSVPAGANPDVPTSGSVRVVLVTGAKAKPFFDDYRTKVSAQPVAGLGDQAYYDGYASLSVLKTDGYVRLAVIGVPDVLAAEKKLAADALPRM